MRTTETVSAELPYHPRTKKEFYPHSDPLFSLGIHGPHPVRIAPPMSHDDRAARVLTEITRAWKATLTGDKDGALACLLRALTALEQDLTFTRCYPDVLDLIVEVAGGLRRAGVRDVDDRATALQLRALGRVR